MTQGGDELRVHVSQPGLVQLSAAQVWGSVCVAFPARMVRKQQASKDTVAHTISYVSAHHYD